jgi:flagellar biosynthesis/type III secretory pathway protein FliH
MSPSARRLSSTVATDRFHWQRAAAPGPGVAPLLHRDASPATAPGPAPAMRDLPSPTAERIQAVEREAFAKGYAEGERAGDAAAAARIEAMIQRLAGMMRRAERELVRLALAMAERVVRREIDLDRELLVVMARVAIDRLGQNAVATIHLHPADCEAALSQRDPAQPSSVEIVADVNVPRGGCQVRSAFGSIDAGIDSQMRELSRALLGDDGAEEESHGLAAGA